jgi:hypothetical protein
MASNPTHQIQHRAAPMASTDRAPEWLEVVFENVASLRFGVVQIIVHDAKVVQIERTERTRLDTPRPASGQ